MSTQNKPLRGASTATHAKKPQIRSVSVLGIVKSKIRELIPAQSEDVFLMFEANLRRYVALQNQASGGRRRLSNLISFTSPRVGPDVLAVPASTYVRDTWGRNGTKILQMVDKATGSGEVREVAETLPNNCYVSITVHENHLYLNIRGAQTSFARIIEQICWIVSVASGAPVSRLANYVKETMRGTTTRDYSETIYVGEPVIRPIKTNGRLNVSFNPTRIEKFENKKFVNTSGHCWKTMTGLSIVASGFAIPPRSRDGLGLEASLHVLRQLIKRGSQGTTPLALDNPMVIFAPRKVDRTDNPDQVSTIKLRYILAAEFERPLRQRGNVIYWHFDPAMVCNSKGSLDQLQKRIGVAPSAIDPNSRHFVGWTSHAGHLAAAPQDIPLGVHSDCIPCPHFQLVLSSLSVSVRVPPVFSVTAGGSGEKTENKIPAAMLANRQQKLHHVSARVFVLWDKHLQRGWLVGGDTAALLMLRVNSKKIVDPRLNSIDFMSLKNTGDSASSAFKVLAELNHKAFEKESDKDPKVKEESIGDYLDEAYAMMLGLSANVPELRKTHAISTLISSWFDDNFGTTIVGADLDELTGSNKEPQAYTYKLKKDPGWLKWTKEEKVTFLFASGLGEILEAKAASCCPYFPTLPTGKDFLASDLTVLKRLIANHSGDPSCSLPDKTVARLSRGQAWERGLHPFQRSRCQGDHLSTLGPECFPVQTTLSVSVPQYTDERLKKEAKLLKSKALYTVKDFNDMMEKYPEGVVVFGRQPGPKELGEISRKIRQRSQSENQQTANPTPTAAPSSDRPSSRASASGSTTGQPLPAPSTEKDRTDRPSSSAQRTPSISSIRSASSSTHPKALQASSTGAAQSQTSTSQSPATSVHKTASHASLRRVGSNTIPQASQTSGTGSVQPRASASRSPAASVHRVASDTSLRSAGSITRPVAANNGTGQSREPGAASNAQTATRKLSSSSVRTTSSVASRATDGSQLQRTPTQPSDAGLKKTNTNSSDKTTSSHSSRVTKNSAAFHHNRQRQQLLEQAGNATAAASNQAPGPSISTSHGKSVGVPTETPHPTSSGSAPTAAGGPEVSS